MKLKLIMTWNILPNHEQEYFDFLVRKFVPNMNRLGFELNDAWATVYGDRPQVMVTALLPGEAEAEERMNSREWHDLLEKLQEYVLDFEDKLVPARNEFQL
ncbi:hypothetical protein BEQ56_04370 [Anaerolineaceae bacterium oral taxon 439]|nr:hypothetical protein BEQ56_04370 [Anaerolineaceae bacterium oral taxon 439]